MKKKMSKKVCLLSLTFAFVICIASIIGIAIQPKQYLASALKGEAVLESELQASYAVGQTVSVPAGQISYNGENITPDEVYIVEPDGVIIKGSSFVADKHGVYTIIYSAKKGGNIIKAEKSFTTQQYNYFVSSDSSSVEFGNLVVAKENTLGIKASLNSGDKLVFNERVDLTQLNGEVPFIRWFDYNNTKREGFPTAYREASQLYIKLTDCYDETKTITVLSDLQKDNSLYFRSWATGQDQMGLGLSEKALHTGQKETFLDGQRYTTYVDRYGTYYWTFRYMPSDNVGTALYYDTDEQRLYMEGARGKVLSMDFDDVNLHGNKAFSGFTTGEVYISVYASGYIEQMVNIEIDQVGEAVGGSLQQKIVQDETGPNIVVDSNGYDVQNADIYIAKNSSVKVFDAQAFDVNGIRALTSSVYFAYGTESQVQVGTKDGYFVPTFKGEYSIVYRVEDGFGNLSEKIIKMNCVDVESVIDFSVPEISGLIVGQTTVLPTCTASSMNGDVSVKMFVEKEGGERVQIDGVTKEVKVLTEGKYTVSYVYTDGIYEVVYSYAIQANIEDYVEFKVPGMPFAFMKDYFYTLDIPTATIYAEDGIKALDVVTSIKEDTNEYKAIDVSDFKVTASSSVQFKYSAGGKSLETDEIKVVDVKKGTDVDMAKYFVGDFSANLTNNEATFTSNISTGNNELLFANPILKDNFYFSFSVPFGKSNYTGVKVEIIDYNNREEFTSFTFKNVGGVMKLYYNGETEPTPVGDSSFVAETYSLSWAEGWKFDNSGTVFKNVANYTSAKVLLKVTLLGISDANSAISIIKINNQGITNRVKDTIKPQLKVDYSISGNKKLNSIVEIDIPTALDVLSPFYSKNLQVMVMDPDGNRVTSEEGILLDGQSTLKAAPLVKLSKYGTYFVAFTYKDQNGSTMDDSFVFFVVDREAPTISLEKGYNEETSIKAKVGEKITLSKYVVSDNVDEASSLTVSVLVFGPHNVIYRPIDNKITFHKKGTYQVRYTCYDQAGNYATIYYTIVVR